MKKLRLSLILIFAVTLISVLVIQFKDISLQNVNILISNIKIFVDSNNASAYFNKGKAYHDLKRYNLAITNYNNAINLDSNNQIFYLYRGHTYTKLKKYRKSLEDLNEAIRLKPDSDRYYYLRGVIYESLNDYKNAMLDYDRVISLKKSNLGYAFKNKGSIYYDLEEYQKAILNYNLAIKNNPELIEAYLLRGSTYHLLKEYSKALADYKYSLKKSNLLQYMVLSNIGLIRYELGNSYKAIEYWKRSLKINPNNIESILGIAVSKHQQKAKDEAIELAITALKLDKQWGNIEFLKGQLWGDSLIEDTQELFKEEALSPLIY